MKKTFRMIGVFLAFFLMVVFTNTSYCQSDFSVTNTTKSVLKSHYESLSGKTLPLEKLEIMVIPTTRNVRTWNKVKTVIETRMPGTNVAVLDEFISELTENVPSGN